MLEGGIYAYVSVNSYRGFCNKINLFCCLSSGGPAKFRKLCRHNFLSRDQFLRSEVILWIYSNTTIVTMLADHQFLFVK